MREKGVSRLTTNTSLTHLSSLRPAFALAVALDPGWPHPKATDYCRRIAVNCQWQMQEILIIENRQIKLEGVRVLLLLGFERSAIHSIAGYNSLICVNWLVTWSLRSNCYLLTNFHLRQYCYFFDACFVFNTVSITYYSYSFICFCRCRRRKRGKI